MIHEAGLLADELAFREDGEVWDALHVIAGGELRAALGVNLQDDCLSCHFRSRLGDMRGSHAAGTTPFGPKIDQYRDGSVLNDIVEERVIRIDRLACRRERLLAGSAAARISKMRDGHSVLRGAIPALADNRHDGSCDYQVLDAVDRLLFQTGGAVWVIRQGRRTGHRVQRAASASSSYFFSEYLIRQYNARNPSFQPHSLVVGSGLNQHLISEALDDHAASHRFARAGH